MQIQFFGAAQQVTGSKHLLTTDGGTRILLDCGLFQGKGPETDKLNRHFGFDPASIDFLLLSHAHIDHSGLLPLLVKQGFRSPIICTHGTQALCRILLGDSAHIQNADLAHVNKRRRKRGEQALEPLYDIEDVELCLSLFKSLNYDEQYRLNEECTIQFTDAGHIIGSAAVHLELKTERGTKRISFTGDIGRPDDKILRAPQPFPQCDVLICESTYGDRLHEEAANADARLLDIVRQTCVEKGGKLIIPAFSVDRTQDLVYQLERMENAGQLPPIKVFVDSPLSVKATHIMQQYTDDYNEDFKKYLQLDPEPFSFRNLVFISEVEQSKELNNYPDPCIIISASGMAEAGRIKHHIMNNIDNPKNTILIVGYCTPDSLGGRLRNGSKMVRIFGDEYEVKATVEKMDFYSAHADYQEILDYLSCQDKTQIEKVFLVHGEYETQQTFRLTLLDKGYQQVFIPAQAEAFKL